MPLLRYPNNPLKSSLYVSLCRREGPLLLKLPVCLVLWPISLYEGGMGPRPLLKHYMCLYEGGLEKPTLMKHAIIQRILDYILFVSVYIEGMGKPTLINMDYNLFVSV